MIPTGGAIISQEVQTVQQPSRTYMLDTKKKRIVGHTDDLEAIKQAVYKALGTSRFHHEIYSSRYGTEMTPLIGKSPAYVQSEISRRITETLAQDDRIERIEDIKSVINGDQILVTFTVITPYGAFEVSQEVSM